MGGIFSIDVLEHMQQKSVEIEEKLINVCEQFDKLKSRVDAHPIQFAKVMKVLKMQIEEILKSKDDVIQTIKSDMTRMTESYIAVLDKQVCRCFVRRCK